MIHDVKSEIVATAARLVVEEGLEYGSAKRRAVRELGLPSKTALPDNHDLEEEIFHYLALFCADTQPAQLRALRLLALGWMERLQDFRPHLSGAVWRGSATRLSDIYIQLFCDDPKSTELFLIDQGIRYEVQAVRGFRGEEVDALSIHSRCPELNEDIGVHLLIYDYDDLRGALQPDERGLAVRGDIAALRKLLDNG